MLQEPVAAALAYARDGLDVGQHLLIYDLGAGTFDLAVSAFRSLVDPARRHDFLGFRLARGQAVR